MTDSRPVPVDRDKYVQATYHKSATSDVRWFDNRVQFARLLCEMVATLPMRMQDRNALAESMDLTPDQVDELFERAHAVWEEAKRDNLTPDEYGYASS